MALAAAPRAVSAALIFAPRSAPGIWSARTVRRPVAADLCAATGRANGASNWNRRAAQTRVRVDVMMLLGVTARKSCSERAGQAGSRCARAAQRRRLRATAAARSIYETLKPEFQHQQRPQLMRVIPCAR